MAACRAYRLVSLSCKTTFAPSADLRVTELGSMEKAVSTPTSEACRAELRRYGCDYRSQRQTVPFWGTCGPVQPGVHRPKKLEPF